MYTTLNKPSLLPLYSPCPHRAMWSVQRCVSNLRWASSVRGRPPQNCGACLHDMLQDPAPTSFCPSGGTRHPQRYLFELFVLCDHSLYVSHTALHTTRQPVRNKHSPTAKPYVEHDVPCTAEHAPDQPRTDQQIPMQEL